MARDLFTHFLPTISEPDELEGGIAVVIDVLRASTTICHALDAGAIAVVPCESVEQALNTAEELGRENVILGGERHGQLIEGFDLDNSPLAYTPESVGGKTVVFTTTNGTRALSRCHHADRILIGTFNNLGAIIEELLASTGPIHLVCAGTNGRISHEDVLFAGAVASELQQELDDFDVDDDETSIATEFYMLNSDEMIPETLADSRGGRNLQALGMDRDIDRAAEVDRFDFVPVYDKSTNRIIREI